MNQLSQKTIDGLMSVSIGSLAKYQVSELHFLLDSASRDIEQLRHIKQLLELAISLKYKESIHSTRLAGHKDSGIVHVFDDEYKISSNIVKKVEWSQNILRDMIDDLSSKHLDPDEFIDIKYNIPERRYLSWHEDIKSMFQPARTVKLSKPYISLQKISGEDLV